MHVHHDLGWDLFVVHTLGWLAALHAHGISGKKVAGELVPAVVISPLGSRRTAFDADIWLYRIVQIFRRPLCLADVTESREVGMEIGTTECLAPLAKDTHASSNAHSAPVCKRVRVYVWGYLV